MKNCSFEKYILPLLANELAMKESDEMNRHLLECEDCSEAFSEIQDMEQLLLTYDRPPAPKSLYAEYGREIAKRFNVESAWKRIFKSGFSFLSDLAKSPTIGYRFARSFAVLTIGVFIGRSLFMTPQAPPPIVDVPAAPILLSSADIQQLNDYFVQSELLLLSIANSSSNSRIAADDLLLNKDIAKGLLLKSTAMQRKADVIDDESIVVFLNHLEFVLLELSNREDDKVHSAFQEIRDMVKEADLVQKSRKLQDKMTRSLSPSA